MIYIGADHRGFKLKEGVKKILAEKPEEHKGMLICGSGVGVDITANKFHGVRSALADDVATAKQSREHDDTNVLSLPADEVNLELAKQIISVWLETPFSNGEKYKRRIDKIEP